MRVLRISGRLQRPSGASPRESRTAGVFAAARRVAAERSSVELIALVATAATPIALFLDYRAHTDVIKSVVTYLPVGENEGRPAAYNQIWGSTQALWIAAAIGVLVVGGWRKFVDNAQLLLLVLALDVLLLATAVYDRIDSTTALTLGATMVPYIAMAAVVRHLDIRLPTVRDLAAAACVGGAGVVALTIAKQAAAGGLSERLGTFSFGPAPEAGVVLAPLLLLVPAMRAARWIKFGVAVCLGAGLLLTQARGALIATFAGTLVLVAAHRGKRLRLAAVTAVGIAAAVVLVFSARSSYSFTDRATDYRRANLEHHWHLFLDRPVLGHGISHGSISAVRAAHNTLLSIANAGGVDPAAVLDRSLDPASAGGGSR